MHQDEWCPRSRHRGVGCKRTQHGSYASSRRAGVERAWRPDGVRLSVFNRSRSAGCFRFTQHDANASSEILALRVGIRRGRCDLYTQRSLRDGFVKGETVHKSAAADTGARHRCGKKPTSRSSSLRERYVGVTRAIRRNVEGTAECIPLRIAVSIRALHAGTEHPMTQLGRPRNAARCCTRRRVLASTHGVSTPSPSRDHWRWTHTGLELPFAAMSVARCRVAWCGNGVRLGCASDVSREAFYKVN